MKKILMRIGNRVVAGILCSPFHQILSRSTLLIALTGHRSGREIMLPVTYFQSGDLLYITSRRARTWWRNLRGSRPVRVWLRGRWIEGQGTAEEGLATVRGKLLTFFEKRPDLRRYFGVRMDARDQPSARDVSRLAQERVLVTISLHRQA